jgi:hypothetical protein
MTMVGGVRWGNGYELRIVRVGRWGERLRVPGSGLRVVRVMLWGNFEFNVLSWEAGRFMESV